MSQVPELQQGKPTKLLPLYFGIAILVIAFIVLAGWQFNIILLAGFVKGVGTMHPFVAISFIATGLFFIADRLLHRFGIKKVVTVVLPLVPIFVGAITLSEFIFNFSSPIETLLYPTKLIAFGYKNVPNHITVCTALELFLTGATLFLMNFKGRWLDILINNSAGFIGLVCLLSYISCVYLIHEFHILVFITAMAIPTGVCLLLSSLAIIYSRPNSGLMSAFTTSYPGNRTARTFLPLSIVIPVVFGLFTVYVLRHNFVNTEVGMTLLFTSLILSMFIVTWYLGSQINKTNIEQLAKEKLRKSEFYYRSIIAQASDGIQITDVKGNISEVNSSMCELLGYTKEELLKLNVSQLIDPEQLKNDPLGTDLLLTGQSFVKERRMIHKNGTVVEVRVNVKMLPDGRVLVFVHNITEEKREEIVFRNLFDQLQVSEAKFRDAFEFSAIGMALVSLDNRLIKVNKQFCSMVGYSESELLAKSFPDFTHPDDIEKNSDLIQKKFRGEIETFFTEKRYINKNGSTVWVQISSTLLKDGNAKPLYFVSQVENITERKNAQRQLQKSEARFKALVENNFDAITLLDVNFKPTYRSPSTINLTGWTDEERQKHDRNYLLHPDDVEDVTETYKKILGNEGVPFSHSYRIKHKEGYYIWVEAVSRNMLSDPDIGAIVIIMRDVTERKSAEQKLAKSEARFKALVENNFDAITLLDSNFKPIYRSPSAQRVTGWTDEDRQKHSDFDILHPDDREMVLESYKKITKNEGEPVSMVYRLKHKEGHYLWIEAITMNMLSDKNIGAYLIIFRDVSEYKNAEEKLLKYNRELFMLNHINDAIVRYKDEDALMNQTCCLLADYGNYPLAWIGFAPEHGEPYQRIEPIAKAGKEVKYLDSIIIDQVDEKMKKGPVATALTTGKLRIINNMDEDLYFEPWREPAKKHGLASIIALPFDISTKRKGILAIYSSQPDAFDRDEVTILQRITENLAHAIRGIRITRERDQAIKQIVKSEEKYHLLFESNPLPMWMFSLPDSTIIDVNEAAIIHYGYSREEFITMNLEKLRPAEDIDRFTRSYQEAQKKGEAISNLGVWRHKKKNGEIISVEILAHDIIYEGKRVRLILSSDITEKLKAEKELHQMNEQLRQFSAHVQNAREDERTKIAREIHDELGQLLTGLKIDVSWLSKKLNSSPQELTKRVDEMLQLTDRTIQSVRRIATELRPGILDDLGLEDAIMWQATEFQNKTGIKCDVEGTLKIKKYSPEVSTAAFRILQESLTNVMRHANAKNVMIKMQESESALHLEVTDDGSGMANNSHNGGQSLGIMGMKERASIIGGWFSITSEPFKGTKVQVEIPFKSI